RHGIDTNVSGACVCGRGISQIAAPSSADTHAHESGFSHSVELINGGNFDPSILGLSLAGGLLPIRLGIDVYQYAQLRQLLVRRNALRDQPQSIDAYTAFNRDQLRITNQSIAETRYRLFVSSPVFYSAVGLNIAGQGIGFAGKSGGGALVGVGGIVFGAGLGILGVLEGGYELYRTMGVAPTVSESQTVSNEVKDEYRRELQRALTAKRVKAASKIAGGGLMIIGTFVPGAQPAVIVGMGILMAPAAAQVSRVLKSKLWSETAHVHLRDLDQLDPQCRLWTFDRIRHEINCFDNLRSELKTGTLSPDDLLRRYAASVKEIHGYKKIDAERRYGYIDAQHRLFRSSGNRDATGMDKRISGLLSELRSDISRHNRVVQSLSRTDCPIEEILNTLSETGDLNRWVVPQTRGILKRFWNRKKLQARVDAGLVKEAPHSSIYHRRYQRSETTAATQIWHYLNRDNTIRKKILRFANRDLHHLKHEIRHLCDYEIACQNRPSLPERNCLKPFRIQHQFTRIDVTDD
ncbi:hypothetical protein EBR96_06765, partial [bacterium]|nr:hypothetical protein [bacterium]